MNNKLNIGLIGCGVVGQGLLELLERQRDELSARFGLQLSISRIAVRSVNKDRGPLAASIPQTTDPMSLVQADDVNMLVEVAGSPVQMLPVLRAALEKKKPVVTANKALVAEHLGALVDLSQRTKTPIACEAAAAGAIPILHALSRRVDRVHRLMAIVNGTSNFILTRMEQDELPLEAAVSRAQALGLAEADPSADIDGLDAAAKLSILTYKSFGQWVQPKAFWVQGIRALTLADVDLAQSLGFKIRHIALADETAEGLLLGVTPALLPTWHLLASVEEEYNAIYLRTESGGDLSFFGKGAGGLPTATAVLGDIVELSRGGQSWATPAPAKQRDFAIASFPRFIRISGERHPALAERIEGQLRRAGLTVHNRASFQAQGTRRQLGFLTSPIHNEALSQVLEKIRNLTRVDDALALPVLEQ